MIAPQGHRVPSSHLLIRADAGRHRGAGHVMRSLAVAEAAREQGWGVTMSADLDAVRWVTPWIEALGVDSVDPADGVAALVGFVGSTRADAVLLDSYDFPDVLRAIEDTGAVFGNFEDAHFGRRPAHLSIDYSLGAEAASRPDDGSATLLRGISFAPIRAAVRAARRDPRGEKLLGPPVVAVLMGGTDARGLAASVETLIEGAGGLTQPVESGLGLVSRLRQVDAVISAAGVSAYELACLGVPMALLQVADNQERNYHSMLAAGAAVGLGTAAEVVGQPALITERLAGWLGNPARMAETARVARSLVDGGGAGRIVSAFTMACQRKTREA